MNIHARSVLQSVYSTIKSVPYQQYFWKTKWQRQEYWSAMILQLHETRGYVILSVQLTMKVMVSKQMVHKILNQHTSNLADHNISGRNKWSFLNQTTKVIYIYIYIYIYLYIIYNVDWIPYQATRHKLAWKHEKCANISNSQLLYVWSTYIPFINLYKYAMEACLLQICPSRLSHVNSLFTNKEQKKADSWQNN